MALRTYLYRRFQDLNARYNQVDSMGCTLADANLFSLPVPEAIVLLRVLYSIMALMRRVVIVL